MVLADLGRKITTALRSLSNATVINEEVILLQSELFSQVPTYIRIPPCPTIARTGGTVVYKAGPSLTLQKCLEGEGGSGLID